MATLQEALDAMLRPEKVKSTDQRSDGKNEFKKLWGNKSEPPLLSDSEFNQLKQLGLRRVSANQVPNRPATSGPVNSSPPLVRTKIQKLPVKSDHGNQPDVAKPVSSVKLNVKPGASYRLKGGQVKSIDLLPTVEGRGQVEQCHQNKVVNTRELAFGLDFGTSSVKVVIGDAAMDKSFAVPFCEGDGICAYLLPTRLYQTDGNFSLESGQVIHSDLKLSFVAEPANLDCQVRIVAFLALVIRRARGWLFTKHLTTYKNTEILWKLCVGLPAASSLESSVSEQLRKLTHLAWRFAGDSAQLNTESICDALDDFSVDTEKSSSLDVAVVPEIAAQIYGFVVSNSFDKNAANNYLMVDVGAGTVDSSLFHVKPGRGGKWDFEFYTAAVEPLGVTNLHRHRVNWWADALRKSDAPTNLVQELLSSKFDSDLKSPLPENFENYFDGIDVRLQGEALNPDKDFFRNQVVTQVRGKTVWRTWKNNLLPQQALTKIPFFLCGGGSRMKYYLALEDELKPQSGFGWLQAEAWTLGVPGDLMADDLSDEDFDRVSVAYGLSRLEVGKVIKAVPMPKVVIHPVDTWRDNYVDKDQC
jgi:hypothetical protein